ncbi:unnamed protein product [Gongylonema pulchrum]|uniref:Helicase ATP-binding domain-containing protein n=2 Tax=Gongylonema pulchrum TaxID=637853 RepID=A0A3P7R962_9BILA|nr:unnamed protein product [Gongylonema pulchrum]
MMRSLPRVKKDYCEESDWYFDFLDACHRDPLNHSLPLFVDPDYKFISKAYRARQKLKSSKTEPTSKAEIPGIPTTIDDYEEEDKPENRTQEHFKTFRRHAMHETELEKLVDAEPIELRPYQQELVESACRGINTIICAPTDETELEKLVDAEPIELRPYQQELVESACRGINTIICAPTGSGKTVVAAHILLEHFRAMKAENKMCRAAMVVPTIPLVEQQCTMLNRFLRKVFWVEGMSGSDIVDDNGRAPYVLASHVTVFTPQVLM